MALISCAKAAKSRYPRRVVEKDLNKRVDKAAIAAVAMLRQPMVHPVLQQRVLAAHRQPEMAVRLLRLLTKASKANMEKLSINHESFTNIYITTGCHFLAYGGDPDSRSNCLLSIAGFGAAAG